MNTPEWIQDSAEVVSLWLTWPTIALGFAVLLHWGPHVYQQVRDKRDLVHQDWLILGIAVSFFGSVFDNLYWGLAWSVDFIESDYREWWFRHGVYANIPFRQICGSYAAYCHLVAFYKWPERSKVRIWFVLSLVGGLLYSCLLALIKKSP